MPKTEAEKKAQIKYISTRKRLSLTLTYKEYYKLKAMADKKHTSIANLIRQELHLSERLSKSDN